MALRFPPPTCSSGRTRRSHAESQTISGLSPNTTYHYRIVATDDVGLVSRSPDATFTTPLAPPAVASMRASITGATAKLTFKCQGMSGQTCSGGFNVTAHEHKSGGTVQAIAAGKHKHKKTKTKVVSVSLGSGAYSVSAGRSATVSFTLKSTGKRLLSQFYKLPTTFTFSATSGTAIAGTDDQVLVHQDHVEHWVQLQRLHHCPPAVYVRLHA